MLLHDPLLQVGTTVSGWAHERPAAEIRAGCLRHRDGTPSDERPLFLDELLDLAQPDLLLQIEVKAHANPALARRTAHAVCERLRDHPMRERTEIISFWTGACEVAADAKQKRHQRRHRTLVSRARAVTPERPAGPAKSRMRIGPNGSWRAELEATGRNAPRHAPARALTRKRLF
jgi:hypothetical protein